MHFQVIRASSAFSHGRVSKTSEFSEVPGTSEKTQKTLEGVRRCRVCGQLGTAPDRRPTPHFSVHLNQTAAREFDTVTEGGVLRVSLLIFTSHLPEQPRWNQLIFFLLLLKIRNFVFFLD